MDTEMIKLKIKCHDKFINILRNHNNNMYLYQQYFEIYESKLQNKNILNDIRNLLQRKSCYLPNIIDNICLENKEIFEDFISF